MNIERMLTLADDLDARTDHFEFDFGVGLHVCRSIGCVAGRAVMLFAPQSIKNAPRFDEDRAYIKWDWLKPRAKKLLDLTDEQTIWLFLSWPQHITKFAETNGDRKAAAKWIREMVEAEERGVAA